MDRMDMSRREYLAETGVHLKWGLTKQEYLARSELFKEDFCECYRSDIYYKFNVEYGAGQKKEIVTLGCDRCGVSKRLTD